MIVGMALGWFTLVATVLSADKIKRIFQRFEVWIDRVTGTILLALGIKVMLSRD